MSKQFVRLSIDGLRVYVDADKIEALTEETDDQTGSRWTVVDLTNSVITVDQSADAIVCAMHAAILE